ncbi:MAG: putative universal stress protein [Blastococcus sp.]|jgi:nucleotide-binding universal stress UspA family protein|nr:putative universal stress protein [Blastococcus sp.]
MSTPGTPLDPAGDDARTSPGEQPGGPSEAEGPPPREIVVGVDGSDCALGAVRWAAREAVRRDAPLRILHAADYLGRQDVSGAPSPELPRARQITAVAYTAARHAARGVRASTEVVPGDPAAALLRAAAGGQLVVLGSSTTGAADEMVFASVALRVSARSPAPVVIVPRLRGRTPTGRPVVAVLGIGKAADDAAVAGFAADAARAARVPLLLLQTRSPRNGAPDAAADLAQWQRRIPDVEVSLTELPGASPSQLLTAMCPSPLVVLSPGPGRVLHRSLDGPHRWLLRHCTSPMALVPPGSRTDVEEHENAAATG